MHAQLEKKQSDNLEIHRKLQEELNAMRSDLNQLRCVSLNLCYFISHLSRENFVSFSENEFQRMPLNKNQIAFEREKFQQKKDLLANQLRSVERSLSASPDLTTV
jgi:hypothetical protein